MGDIANMNDCDRWMRSDEGQAHLEDIRQMLVNRTITDVSFSNEVHYVATVLHLNGGDTFFVMQPSLEIDALREQFGETIEREYYRDYPERRPSPADPA